MTPEQSCYAGDRIAVAECTNCGQPFCEAHRGIEPRSEWCAECVANAKVENALDWSFRSGCVLGLAGGSLLWLVLVLAGSGLAQGPGRGFVIVIAAGLLGAAFAYVARRAHLR